ncbi:MAG: penicillin acylase family protein [Acetobacteraceae bacterium]|nr:penicillin acylase family protein [Acetobacteraceae bacterium]
MPRRRRRSVWGRLLGGLFVAALAVPLLLAGAVWWTLPAAREEPRIAGLSAPVAIAFDAAGIPRITAANERDFAMALGWLHARDRMFQMDAMRRGAQGRLAEIAGTGALRLDRFSRLLGLRQRAEADLAALDEETRGLLGAYAAGVNARIAERGRWIAPEFLALGAPEPWEPTHSLLWAKVMGLWLSGNYRAELERAGLARVLGERMWDLWPQDRTAGRADLASLPDPGGLLARVPVFPVDAPLPPMASNAWAVGPSRSATGGALLAADPHLGFSAPVLWYLARVDFPDGRMLAGATSPGVPLVVIGRNARLAWGFTTTHSDTQDVFVERLAGPDAYETEDGPRPFTTRRETIRVRGGEPVEMLVRETRNGPVISDLDGPRTDGTVLAVRMANLEPRDTAAQGLLALTRAANLAEARRAASLITSPPQNLMVADAEGGIALYLTGRTPIRRQGDGSLPTPGTAPWAGFIPFDDLPHVENPASAQIVNANNRVSPEGHPAFLGRDFHGDWRFRRIQERLRARPRHDVPGFAAIQMDEVSLLAREALPLLRSLPRGSGPVAAAQALLADWDGTMAADAPQPLIWAAFARRMPLLALRQAGVTDAPAGPEFLRFLLTDPRAAAWCNGDCRAMATLALTESVQELVQRHGADPAAWRWGPLHAARFEHPLLRFVPGLNRLIRLEAPTGGDGETVHRGGIRGPAGTWNSVHGAGLRFVADLSSPDGGHAIIATGQSGHFMSRHWGDLLADWQAGRVRRLDRQAGPVAVRLSP